MDRSLVHLSSGTVGIGNQSGLGCSQRSELWVCTQVLSTYLLHCFATPPFYADYFIHLFDVHGYDYDDTILNQWWRNEGKKCAILFQ